MTDWEVLDVFESCGLTVVETRPDVPDEGEEKILEEREEFVVVESPNGGPPIFKPKRSSPDAQVKPETSADARPDGDSTRDRVVFLKNAEAESNRFAEEVAHLNESVCLLQKEQRDCNKAIAEIRKEAQDEGRKLTDDEQAQIIRMNTMIREEIGPDILCKNNRLGEIRGEIAKEMYFVWHP